MPSYKQKKQRLRQLVKKQQDQRIKKIQQQGHNFIQSDQFKKVEKHYKFYQHIQTDFSKLLKLNQQKNCKSFQIDGYKIYQFSKPQGSYLIKNFVNTETQYQIGYEALNSFIFRPYRTNLDGTNGLQHENANQTQLKKNKSHINLKDVKNKKQEINQQSNNQVPLQHHKVVQSHIQNQKILQGIDFQNPDCSYYFNQKIRMANLGYQYDWPHRSYPSVKVPIPSTITNLTSKATSIYQKIKKSEIEYHGQAIIVNYYKLKDYMTGHLDDGQQDQINPIFSFCFGLSCVFLLGGPTRQTQPIAIKLDAGDLLIMSGYSRICYHGVPRIIEGSYQFNNIYKDNKIQNKQQNAQKIDNQLKNKIRKHLTSQIEQIKKNKQIQNIDKRYLNEFDHVFNYFQEHRININVRQVWVRKGQR